MKRAILEGAKVGAIAGFSLAILNAVLVLISVELSWPLSTPQKVVIFTSDFISEVIPSLLFASPEWLILPTLIGSATASIFGFVLVKFKPRKKMFVFICTILCSLTTNIYLATVVGMFGSSNYGASRWFEVIFESPMIGIVLLIFPGIFYILAAIFVSQYLFNWLSNPFNVISPAP